MTSSLSVAEVGTESAADVLAVTRAAFLARPALDPPSTATDETEESVAAVLADAGGLLVLRDGRPAGSVLFDTSRPGRLGMRRVSVDPAHQGHGVASVMVGMAEDVAEGRGLDGTWLLAREELPDNILFWERRGYVEIARGGPSIELAKTLWLARALPTAEDTRAFGSRLATLLARGDVVLLTGGLGAGKTTLAQGLGAGLGVRGDVTSPTFVISRVHPALGPGPDLVHVDAYRLGGTGELDDLDLDLSVPTSVTVVEWGAGLAEGLADSWLDVRLDPLAGRGAAALAAAGADRRVPPPDPETRVASVRPVGPRWAAVPLRSTLLGALR